jgi:hypothetical protein
MGNAITGKRVQTSVELEAAKNSAQQQAEMAALLARYRQQFGDLPETSGGEIEK